MKKNNIYCLFDKVILRTPLYPFVESDNVKKYDEALFKEALYYASSNFYSQAIRSSSERVSKTLYKYLSRACTRCTPFGLFAATSVVDLGENTNIVLSPIEKLTKYVRLDVQSVFSTVRYLENKLSIKYKIKYYSNHFLYKSYNGLRYYETILSDTGLNYNIVEVLKNRYLDKILSYAKEGKTINEISEMLTSLQIEKKEAIEYIDTLIENQLLVSELALSEYTHDWFDKIVNFLDEIGENDQFIEDIYCNLRKIESSSNGVYRQKNITDILNYLDCDNFKKNKFHVDAFRSCSVATLSRDITRGLLDCITFLSRIVDKNDRYLLDSFRAKFLDRYENQTIGLLTVLDSDLGIDYLNPDGRVERNGLLKDLVFPASENNEIVKITSFKKKLFKKYVEAIKNCDNEIVFTDEDIDDPNTLDNDAFPATLPVLCSLYKEGASNADVLIRAIGSSTASAILGRFSYLDSSVQNIVNDISFFEKQYCKDCIVAEIAYLPDDNVGNIMVKSQFRDFEIPIQNKGEVKKHNQIPLSDLTIQFVNEKFVLRSKRLNKRVIPFLSSAYNYQKTQLPIVRFLCDLQFQEKESISIIDWGIEYDEIDYFPRIRYKNCIINRQKWRILQHEIQNWRIHDKSISPKHIQFWREKRNLPSKVVYTESDNELLIDFDNIISVEILLDIIKKKKNILVEEFLYSAETAIVADNKNFYCNEFVLLLKKS